MEKYPQVMIVSDEIYYLLAYRDSEPVYYYQKNPGLLGQTIIIDGISKFFASTGLRLGWAIAPSWLVKGMNRFQAQTTSGANSLIQRSFLGVNLPLIKNYLEPIKKHLKTNADTVKDIYFSLGMENSWYQVTSAFYYLMDFSHTRHAKGEDDCSGKVCEKLLETYGIVTAPGNAFGVPHSIRINLAMEKKAFRRSCRKNGSIYEGMKHEFVGYLSQRSFERIPLNKKYPEKWRQSQNCNGVLFPFAQERKSAKSFFISYERD